MRYIPEQIVKLYDYVPSYGRNLLASSFGIVKKYKEYNKGFFEQLKEIRKNEWQSYKYLEELQLIRLKNLIDYAYKKVPYYKNIFSEYGIVISQIQNPDDLKSLPILTKDNVIKNFYNLISENYRNRKIRIEHTSGTTGKPLQVAMDERTFHYADAVQYQMFQWAGFDLGKDWLGRMAGNKIIPIKDKTPPFWTKNYILKQLHLSSYHLNINNAKLYAEQLMKNKIKFMSGYPSSIGLLAKLLEQKDITYKLEAVFLSSEPIYNWQKHSIEKVFGAKIYNNYGQSERILTAISCRNNLKMHFNPESVILELLPKNEKKSIICTSLINYAMPLIRYEMNDITEGIEYNCSCGREQPLILPIETKSEDFVIKYDGTFIHLHYLHSLSRNLME